MRILGLLLAILVLGGCAGRRGVCPPTGLKNTVPRPLKGQTHKWHYRAPKAPVLGDAVPSGDVRGR